MEGCSKGMACNPFISKACFNTSMLNIPFSLTCLLKHLSCSRLLFSVIHTHKKKTNKHTAKHITQKRNYVITKQTSPKIKNQKQKKKKQKQKN